MNICESKQSRIRAITDELLAEQHNIGRSKLLSYIKQGLLLIEAKEVLMHKEWLPWLKANFLGKDRKAAYYMELARGYENQDSQLIANLTLNKAIKLLEIAPDKREEFLDSVFVIKGVHVKARDMTDVEFNNLFPKKNNNKDREAGSCDVKSDDDSSDYYVPLSDTSNYEIEAILIENGTTVTEQICIESNGTNNTNDMITRIESDYTTKPPVETTTTDKPEALKESKEDESSNTHGAYERHIKIFDDCIYNVRSNLKKMFEVREICQDKPDLRSSFNDQLISMFETYLNILGYTINKHSDNSYNGEFRSRIINGLEEIPDMIEVAV